MKVVPSRTIITLFIFISTTSLSKSNSRAFTTWSLNSPIACPTPKQQPPDVQFLIGAEQLHCDFTPIPTMPGITYSQHPLALPSYPRGSHLITSDITSQLSEPLKGVKAGLLHLFLQHTSCALSLNENWDSDVRKDMSDSLDKIVVEDRGAFELAVGWRRHGSSGRDK